MEERPHIGFVYLSLLPESFTNDTQKEFGYDGLNISVTRQDPQPFASGEWMVPSLITAYLLKPYFDGFLKEAGKDHFQLLKSSLGKLLRYAKETAGSIELLSSSAEKRGTPSSQSKVLSIYIETKYGKRVKILFDDRLTLDDWENGLSNILDQFYESYLNAEGDGLSEAIEAYSNHPNLEVYATLDRQTKAWRFLNLRDAVRAPNEK